MNGIKSVEVGLHHCIGVDWRILLHKFVKVEMVPRLELVYVDIKIGNAVVKKKDLEYRLRCPLCEEESKK